MEKQKAIEDLRSDLMKEAELLPKVVVREVETGVVHPANLATAAKV